MAPDSLAKVFVLVLLLAPKVTRELRALIIFDLVLLILVTLR